MAMSNAGVGGYYMRRRGITRYEREGKANLNDMGLHDFLCRNCSFRKSDSADIPGGVWVGTYGSILDVGSNRSIRNVSSLARGFKKLEEKLEWIKEFRVGKEGHAYVINKFLVFDTNGNCFSVDAKATEDWRKPVYIAVTKKELRAISEEGWTPENVENLAIDGAVTSEAPSGDRAGTEPKVNNRKQGTYAEVETGASENEVSTSEASSNHIKTKSLEVVDSIGDFDSLIRDTGDLKRETTGRNGTGRANSEPQNSAGEILGQTPNPIPLPKSEAEVGTNPPHVFGLSKDNPLTPTWVRESWPTLTCDYRLATNDSNDPAKELARQYNNSRERPKVETSTQKGWVETFKAMLELYSVDEIAQCLHWATYTDYRKETGTDGKVVASGWAAFFEKRNYSTDLLSWLTLKTDKGDRWDDKIMPQFRKFKESLNRPQRPYSVTAAPPSPVNNDPANFPPKPQPRFGISETAEEIAATRARMAVAKAAKAAKLTNAVKE